jgi:hypothetical protein
MDPHQFQRVGYMVQLSGFGFQAAGNWKGLAKDLLVTVPFNESAGPIYKGMPWHAWNPMPNWAEVAGVISSFEWRGGACDPIEIEFYISQQNALQIKQLMQKSLLTTKVESMIWWLADYDNETKLWYDQSYPQDPDYGITGRINGRVKPELETHLTPEKIADNVDVNIYKTKISVVPAGDQLWNLIFAASPKQPVVRCWGALLGGQNTST